MMKNGKGWDFTKINANFSNEVNNRLKVENVCTMLDVSGIKLEEWLRRWT